MYKKVLYKISLFSSPLIFGCSTTQSQSSMMSEAEEKEYHRQKLISKENINLQRSINQHKNISWETPKDILTGCYLLEESNFFLNIVNQEESGIRDKYSHEY